VTRTESITILLSSILAVEGWLLTHIADRINQSPLLEYRVDHEEGGEGRKLILQVQNLSRNISYKNLDIVVTAGRGGTIESTEVVPVVPASEGDEAPVEAKYSSRFTIPNLMPSSIVRAYIAYKGTDPFFRLSSNDQPIMAVQPNAETFIARHEVVLLILLIPLTLLAGVAIIFVLNWFHRPVGNVDE